MLKFLIFTISDWIASSFRFAPFLAKTIGEANRLCEKRPLGATKQSRPRIFHFWIASSQAPRKDNFDLDRVVAPLRSAPREDGKSGSLR